jgi:hypothetical protein
LILILSTIIDGLEKLILDILKLVFRSVHFEKFFVKTYVNTFL